MKGRIKGQRDRIITLAHQIEAMARQKRLKPVTHYLKQKKRARGDGGEQEVLAMMKGLAAKGRATVKRVKKGKKDGG